MNSPAWFAKPEKNGVSSWDLGPGFSLHKPVRNARLTVRCEYPDMAPTEVTFRLSPSYGLTTGHEANEWFIEMMYEHEEFEVETDRARQSGV